MQQINGIEKGKDEEKIEIAKNMIKKGMAVEIIEEITGLSKEKIEDLEKNVNRNVLF